MPTNEQQVAQKKRRLQAGHKQQQHSGSGSIGSGANNRSSGGGSIWRQLFSCTDPMSEDDDLAEFDARPASKSKNGRARGRRGRKGRQATIEEATTEEEDEDNDSDDEGDGEEDEDTATVEPRRKQKQKSRAPQKQTKASTPDDRQSQSKDSFWQKLFRGGDSNTVDSSTATATVPRSQKQQRAKSPYVGNRRRHKKRLVLAMLEDDDGATNTDESQVQSKAKVAMEIAANNAVKAAAARNAAEVGMQIHATRDETNIRRILQSLSDSLKTELPTSASAEDTHQRQPEPQPRQSQQTTSANSISMQLSSPSELQQIPQHQQQHQQPEQLKPTQQQQQGAAAPAAVFGPQPSSPEQPQPKLQQQAQPKPPPPQPPWAAEPSSNRNRRHGYRIFHRVCSAAENYYAVPFPPLETLRFKEDDDGQWEDQEVYVASHKGLFALKPRSKSSQSRLDKSRLMKGVGRLGATTTGRHGQQQQQQQQQQPQQHQQTQKKHQQSSGRLQADDCAKQQKVGQQQAKNRMAKQQQTRQNWYALQQQQQQQQQQRQQQQLNKFQRMPTKLLVLNHRRAEPIDSSRLLHQLDNDGCQPAASGNPADSAAPGPNGARPTGALPSYMRPYSPLQRAKWTAGPEIDGSRCPPQQR